MKKNTQLLQADTFYHIYNRGNNRDNIFFEKKNYNFFLAKYDLHLSPVVDTYVYCLLKNHFHFLIRSKTEETIKKINSLGETLSIPLIISQQFANFFKSYTASINKAYGRVGSLFENPFRRVMINSSVYFSHLVYYIHYNPQKHNLIEDFKNYTYSSYHSHLSDKPSKLKRVEVLNWFGDKKAYIDFHTRMMDEKTISHLIIE